jgi:hypothetical protein
MPRGVNPPDPEDFSLVLGGPLYQLYLRTQLVRPPLERLYRRIAALTLLAWLPLLILTALAGTFSHDVEIPFLYDIDVHARLLVSLTLLVGAELFVHKALADTVRQFVDRDLIAAEDRACFENAVAGTIRLRNSVPIEIVVLVSAVLLGNWLWRQHLSGIIDTWYVNNDENGAHLTAAGCWYAFVSLPIFDFLLLRWYFRMAIWYRFLWLVSRFDLQLNALHPDRAGGIGFLGQSVFAFAPVLVAHTVLASGLIGDRIWHRGASLPEFQLEIIGIVAFLLLLSLTPLCFFSGQMAQDKQAGRCEYGAQASLYVNEFRRKWLTGGSDAAGSFLGSADIQSLADLGGSYDVVNEMRLFPLGRNGLVALALIVAAPFAPLILTMVPLEEMLGRLLKFAL